MGLIISLVVSLVAPDLSENACGMILGVIPTESEFGIGDCECEVELNGFFTIAVDATASCPLTVGDQTCEFTIEGGGGAIDIALIGGDGDLTFSSSSCDIGVGLLTFSVDGAFSTNSLAVNDCSINVAGNDGDEVDCSCANIGCEGDLSAEITCSINDSSVISDQCVNFAELPAFLEENLQQTMVAVPATRRF